MNITVYILLSTLQPLEDEQSCHVDVKKEATLNECETGRETLLKDTECNSIKNEIDQERDPYDRDGEHNK